MAPDALGERQTLLLGADRTEITPPATVPLAGYAARSDLPPAADVLAPLHVRTLAIGANDPIALVSADLLWWGDDVVERVKKALPPTLHPDRLVLHATHTHSGPQTAGYMTPALGRPDPDYLDFLIHQTVASIERALDLRVPVRARRGEARSSAGVDRRWARGRGELPPSPIDDRLTYTEFVDAHRRPVAAWVHFACHPVLHHGNAVTSDLAGALSTALEATLAPVALYLQGCCGDVNPARYDDEGSFHHGGQDLIDDFASGLLASSRQAHAAAADAGDPAVALHRANLDLPLAPAPTPDEVPPDAPAYLRQWSALMMQRPRTVATLRLHRIDLTTGLQLLGLSGEPVSEYGRFVSDITSGRALALGYTGGMTTYLTTAEQIGQGGYEPCQAPWYFGMPAALATDAEATIKDAITALTQR